MGWCLSIRDLYTIDTGEAIYVVPTVEPGRKCQSEGDASVGWSFPSTHLKFVESNSVLKSIARLQMCQFLVKWYGEDVEESPAA